MAVGFAEECDIGQGFNFKSDEHHTFGYLTQLILGDNVVAPDIRINTNPVVGTLSAVVAVLSHVDWSTLPNENIAFEARVSLANKQLLAMLAQQSLKNVVFKVAFVIYRYDPLDRIYYTSFRSHAGTAPTGLTKPSSEPPLLQAKLGKTANHPGLKLGSEPEADPPGLLNHALNLGLAPPIAKTPQQILIQAAVNVKMIKAWGIPQT